jgi:hypothetical protein
MTTFDLDLSKYQLGWSDSIEYAFTPERGINPGVVEQISWWKGEPRWMTQMRQRALRLFERKPMAEWFAVNMPDIDFQNIYYYLRPAGEQVDEWDQLPEEMMRTYEKLGIPEAERQYLAGVTAQFESEVVYHKNRDDLAAQGILFCDMDTALRRVGVSEFHSCSPSGVDAGDVRAASIIESNRSQMKCTGSNSSSSSVQSSIFCFASRNAASIRAARRSASAP